MQQTIGTILVIAALSFATLAQEVTREQKIKDIFDLRSRISVLEKEILRPDTADLASAREQGFDVIRLLPRETYENVLAIRGGGAYCSFARGSQEYGYGSDISLEQGHLSVGFAGADYGFIIDLADVSLGEVGKESPAVEFLANYVPPKDEPAIRVEQRRSRDYAANGFVYKSRVPAVVGHTYVLRSIGFSQSDILVAFSIRRKDPDGSLIIFWKQIDSFAKPEIKHNAASAGR